MCTDPTKCALHNPMKNELNWDLNFDDFSVHWDNLYNIRIAAVNNFDQVGPYTEQSFTTPLDPHPDTHVPTTSPTVAPTHSTCEGGNHHNKTKCDTKQHSILNDYSFL